MPGDLKNDNAPMTYAGVGVDYDPVDAAKVVAQQLARSTSGNITAKFDGKYKVHEPSRGESAFLIETPDSYIAQVIEGLGTKGQIADGYFKGSGISRHKFLAQCWLATGINDLVTLGAHPLSVAMYLSVGDGDWYKDQIRVEELLKGFRDACDVAGTVWGPGEMPVYPDTYLEGKSDMVVSVTGVIDPKSRLIRGDIEDGDEIVIIESSGLHTNGSSYARRIAAKISPDPERPELGYLEKLPSGQTFGEALLAPTVLYGPLVEACLDAGIFIKYAINITGHGLRKIMRSPLEFTYVVEVLPHEKEVFPFMQEHGPIEDRQAYGNLNMGAGFVLIVPRGQGRRVVEVNAHLALESLSNWSRAFVAGHVEAGPKQVVIKPKNITFAEEELAVR